MEQIYILDKSYEDYYNLTYTIIKVKNDNYSWTMIIDDSLEYYISLNNIINIDKKDIQHLVHISTMLIAKMYSDSTDIIINNELFRSDKVVPIRQGVISRLIAESLREDFDKRYILIQPTEDITMKHNDLLTALLNGKAIQSEFIKPTEDGDYLREILQFDEHDQLTNYFYDRDANEWILNDSTYFSLLEFIIDDTEARKFEIVDKINMDGKLSDRDIIQALIDPNKAVKIMHSFDDYASQSMIQLVDGTLQGYQPVDDNDPNGLWDTNRGIPLNEWLDNVEKDKLYIFPSLLIEPK